MGPVSADDEPFDYPEGGRMAWAVVFGSFCVSFSVFGLINTSAVFESYFSRHQLQGESPSNLAWIFSVYLFLIYFLGNFAGPAFDRHGNQILILTGSILVVAAQFILSYCSGEETKNLAEIDRC
jgi:MFS family permease